MRIKTEHLCRAVEFIFYSVKGLGGYGDLSGLPRGAPSCMCFVGGAVGISKSITFFICLGFLGCNKIQMADISKDSGNNPLSASQPGDEPRDTPIVRESCENLLRNRITKAISFPKPAQTCEWEKNGNLETKNLYFQARIEQTQYVDLPAGAIICDIKMNFNEQQFLYDDHFLMNFNSAVVASSFDFSAQLNAEFGLLRYDWSRIAGMYWDKDKEGTFCAPGGTCAWPDTDTAGVITMQYPSAVIQRLMAEDINRTRHQLQFISIGDNDDKDCEHSAVNFSMDVEYVTKP